MDWIPSARVIDPHDDQPPASLGPTEDEVGVTMRVISLVAINVGQYLFNIRD
jgi:hypothetical protein